MLRGLALPGNNASLSRLQSPAFAVAVVVVAVAAAAPFVGRGTFGRHGLEVRR